LFIFLPFGELFVTEADVRIQVIVVLDEIGMKLNVVEVSEFLYKMLIHTHVSEQATTQDMDVLLVRAVDVVGREGGVESLGDEIAFDHRMVGLISFKEK
jgi:hypothetical protein